MSNIPNRNSGIKAAWLLAALIAIVIFALSAQPHSAEFTSRIFGRYNHLARPLAHMTEFAVLFLGLRWALSKTFKRLGFLVLCMVAFALCGSYAIFDEWHQGFVPGRTSSVNHVLLDLVGTTVAFVGTLVVAAWRRFRQ